MCDFWESMGKRAFWKRCVTFWFLKASSLLASAPAPGRATRSTVARKYVDHLSAELLGGLGTAQGNMNKVDMPIFFETQRRW